MSREDVEEPTQPIRTSGRPYPARAAVPPAPTDGDALTPAREPRAARLALLLVILLGAGLVALHIHTYRQLSQYDEAQHVDYVYELLQGHVPASGDRWLPATTLAVACRTIDSPWPYPPCGPGADNGRMPNYGLTTEFQQPPLYYLVPGAAAWTSSHLLPVHLDAIDVMRATGVLWLALGLLLLWLLWRDLAVPWLPRMGLSLGLIAAPTLLLAHSTVTNDGSAFAAGAAVTLATLRWASGRWPMWVPVAVGLVALALKVTNVAVLLMACAFVVVRALQQSGRGGAMWRGLLAPRVLVFVGCCGLMTLLVALGWAAIQGSRQTIDPALIVQNMIMATDHLEPRWVMTAVPALLSPLASDWLPSAMAGLIGTWVGHVADIGLLLLAAVGAVRSKSGSVLRALGIATAVAALVFGPVMVVADYVLMHMYFEIPARYGFSLVAPLAVLAGTAVRSRPGQLALVAAGAALYAAVALQLLR